MNPRLIVICHGCENRQRECAGPCACGVDGLDIVHHASTEYCPESRFDGIPQYYPAPDLPASEQHTADNPILLARLAVCNAPCEHNKSISDSTHNGYRVVRVSCDACKECGHGRSLSAKNQTCPLGQW